MGDASASPVHDENAISGLLGDAGARKRVTQACGRCRLKKVKCDGSNPCRRCQADDAVCWFDETRSIDNKPVSGAHLNQIRIQQRLLVRALQNLWTKHEKQDDEEIPSVHSMVKALVPLSDSQEARSLDADFDFEESVSGDGEEYQTTERHAPVASDIEVPKPAPNILCVPKPASDQQLNGLAESLSPKSFSPTSPPPPQPWATTDGHLQMGASNLAARRGIAQPLIGNVSSSDTQHFPAEITTDMANTFPFANYGQYTGPDAVALGGDNLDVFNTTTFDPSFDVDMTGYDRF